jgi:hypothetical protein
VSHTDRNEKRLPRERDINWTPGPNFIPSDIVINGANRTDEENEAYIRWLLGPDLRPDDELEVLRIISEQGR